MKQIFVVLFLTTLCLAE